MTIAAGRNVADRRAVDATRVWSRHDHQGGTVGLLDPDPERGAEAVASVLTPAGLGLRVYTSVPRALARLGIGRADVLVVSAAIGADDLAAVVETVRDELSIPVLLAFGADHVDVIGAAVLAGARPVLSLPLRADELLPALHDAWPARPARTLLEIESLVLDPVSYDAQVRGAGIDLSVLEFDVLHELALHADHVVARAYFAQRFWPRSTDPDGTMVAAISRLRRKLDGHGVGEAIHTVRGLGYRLESSCLRAQS